MEWDDCLFLFQFRVDAKCLKVCICETTSNSGLDNLNRLLNSPSESNSIFTIRTF